MPSVELILTELNNGKEAERIALLCAGVMPKEFFSRLTIFGPLELNITNPHIRFVRTEFFRCPNLHLFNVWMLRECVRYIDAEYALFVHTDGYILNPELWEEEWFQYDYIGAPWASDRNGGNGGFSFRSKALMEAVKDCNIPIPPDINEDEWICGKINARLCNLGLRFAPFDVAKKFSLELPIEGNERTFTQVFGFHGKKNLEIINAAFPNQ